MSNSGGGQVLVGSYEPPAATEAHTVEIESEEEEEEETARVIESISSSKNVFELSSSSAVDSVLPLIEEASSSSAKLHTFPPYIEPSIERWIIMDWAVDDRLFTIENYKALGTIFSILIQLLH